MQLHTTDHLAIDLDVLASEPAEHYHAQARTYLSSHQLLDFMTCPWLYRKKRLGLIEDGDTPAMRLGRAAHVRILEGRDAYEASYALGGPINPKTDKPYGTGTKAFARWAKQQGKPVLSHDQVELVEKLASGVAMNDQAVDLLLYGRSEGVIRTGYCDRACQVRLDWVHPHRGLVDLKTTADLTWFELEARRRRYVNQAAFYQAILGKAVGELVPVHLVAVEKIEPYRCGVWRISEQTLAVARQENEAAIRRLIRAHRIDAFGTGYEEIRVLEIA